MFRGLGFRVHLGFRVYGSFPLRPLEGFIGISSRGEGLEGLG